MKTFKFLLTLFIAVTAAFVLYGCSGSDCDNGAIGASHIAPAAKGTITGTVRDTNGNPIGGVNVAATNIRASAVTAEDGTYSITDLAFGVYSVTAVHNGTTLDTKEVTISSTTPQAIADFLIPLDEQQNEPQIGTISGTITFYDDDEPFLGLTTIQLLDSTDTVIKTVNTTTGTFKFEDIELGTYTVRALPQINPDDAVAPIITDSPTGQAIVSKTALNPTVDLKYAPLKGTISGTIKDFDGTPFSGSATIQLLDSANDVKQTVTTTTGTFTFENVDLGTYTVKALPQMNEDDPLYPYPTTTTPEDQAIVSKTDLHPTVELQYQLLPQLS